VASAVGTRYSVTATLSPTVPATGPQLAEGNPLLAPYLALPSLPAIVSALAHQAVGKAATPVAEAQTLVNWFRSGRFRYTLSPPATSGSDPLVQFLTVTKAGFCQQFAGAYAVLARSLGIPTRLVVGFTAGKPGAGGTYTVTGADAHVWPQVYLGPDAGWISVEPTPTAAGAPVAADVLGPSDSGTQTSGGGAAATTTTTAPARSVAPAGSRPKQSKPKAHASHRPHPRQASPRHGTTLWVLAAVLAALALLAGAAYWVLRRRRSVREARLQPDERVVRAWDRSLVALRRRGLPRRLGETPGEYAARVHAVESSSAEPVEAAAVADLADLVEVACYAPRPCTLGQADRAQVLASTIVATNRSHRRRERRRSGGRAHRT
jgi:uncharacterized membrane protein